MEYGVVVHQSLLPCFTFFQSFRLNSPSLSTWFPFHWFFCLHLVVPLFASVLFSRYCSLHLNKTVFKTKPGPACSCNQCVCCCLTTYQPPDPLTTHLRQIKINFFSWKLAYSKEKACETVIAMHIWHLLVFSLMSENALFWHVANFNLTFPYGKEREKTYKWLASALAFFIQWII